MNPITAPRRRLRWGLRHGIVRLATRRGVRAGSLPARLMTDRELIGDPFAAYEELRARGRLVPNGPVLLAHDHDLCTAVLRSPDFGVVGGHDGTTPPLLTRLARIAGPGPVGPVERPSMLAVDAPDHTRFRRLVTRAFTARAVAQLRERTEAIASDLLDAMAAAAEHPAAGDGTSDLVADFASLLPATVIAEMLGAPVAMRRQFLAWGAGAALSLDPGMTYPEFRRSEADLQALDDWMRGHFDGVRQRGPVAGQDILSDLVLARDEHGALTDTELASVAMLLLAAGFETTVNLIGNAVVLLTTHPDQLALLREDPGLWPQAVDEVLRFDSPVQRTARVAHRDTIVAGEQVPAGKIVITVLGAANRDPAVFADPQTFDVTRVDAGAHLAFSSGAHYCLGAALARMEGEVALRALFDRFPDLALAGVPHRRPTRVLRGYDALPVRLTPSDRAGSGRVGSDGGTSDGVVPRRAGSGRVLGHPTPEERDGIELTAGVAGDGPVLERPPGGLDDVDTLAPGLQGALAGRPPEARGEADDEDPLP
ncbi:MAG: cytochrome P450 [Lapillicoccus sp.]